MGSEGKSAPPADAHTSGDVPSSPQPTLPGLCTEKSPARDSVGQSILWTLEIWVRTARGLLCDTREHPTGHAGPPASIQPPTHASSPKSFQGERCSQVLTPPHQRAQAREEDSSQQTQMQDATREGKQRGGSRATAGSGPRALRPLTSRVRISCCVRSLDTEHLVRSPRRLPMEISMSFCSWPHCCSARLAAAPAPPSVAAAASPPPPSFFSPIAAARKAALSIPRHRGRGGPRQGARGARAPRRRSLKPGRLH